MEKNEEGFVVFRLKPNTCEVIDAEVEGKVRKLKVCMGKDETEITISPVE